MLPARKQPIRSGIARAVRRHWPRHEKWVRGFGCCVPACELGPIEFAHARLGAKDNGVSVKSPSWYGLSLCFHHHTLQHAWGEATFEKHFGIDMKKLAAEFAAKSPDAKMREAMQNG